MRSVLFPFQRLRDGMEKASSTLAADLIEFKTSYPDMPLAIKLLKGAAEGAISFSIQPLLDLDSFRRELTVLHRIAKLTEQDFRLVCYFTCYSLVEFMHLS
jgi:hypothetical protein